MHLLSPQLEADRRLLNFKDYEDYLDSLMGSLDDCYLRSTVIARTIAGLGYRSCGETLTRAQFYKKVQAVLNYLSPPYKPYELASENMKTDDPIRQQLAIRERPNRMGILSTIIYVRLITKSHREIAGYIDFQHRLTREDWKPFFLEGKMINPNLTDLGYYHWDKRVLVNDSYNYKVLIDPNKGLVFQNRFDRKMIVANPECDPGSNTKRTRVNTNLYLHVVLFDHLVRQRI